jgi:ferredoxin-NADP reductase
MVAQLENIRSTPIEDPIVCNCLQIRRTVLENAIANGASEMETLVGRTGASSVCGACHYTLQEMVGQAKWEPVRLVDVEPVTDNIHTFRFASPTGSLDPAEPAQFVILKALIGQDWVQRPYTISSAASTTTYREITVKRLPDGVFSNWLFDEATVNSPIYMSPPQGTYQISADPLVCFVAGIGVTPALGMMRSYLYEACLPASLLVHYSVSTENEIVYQDELAELEAAYDLRVHVTNQAGHLTFPEVREICQDYPNARFFICGPTRYQEALTSYLAILDVPKERIHVEIFVPKTFEKRKSRLRYVWLGLTLLAAFGLQWWLDWDWAWLEGLQLVESYKRWSGFALGGYLGLQFLLPVTRWFGSINRSVSLYRWHRWQGAFAPLVYYFHSTEFGYAAVGFLSAVYFANMVVGLFNQELIADVRWKMRYQRVWLIFHIVLSLLLVGLALVHLYVVFAFQ